MQGCTIYADHETSVLCMHFQSSEVLLAPASAGKNFRNFGTPEPASHSSLFTILKGGMIDGIRSMSIVCNFFMEQANSMPTN